MIPFKIPAVEKITTSLKEVTLKFVQPPPVRALSLVLFVGDYALQDFKPTAQDAFVWKLPTGVREGDELRLGWTIDKKSSENLGFNLVG